MSVKWFHIYQGVAQSVEYVEENSTTTAINFQLKELNGLVVNVPGQANNKKLIKEHDLIDFCVRPSIINKDKTICLAYRIHNEGNIYSINELRHLIMVILGFIFGPVYVIYMGWKWPLLLIVVISIYYAISSFLSFYARGCLARAKL